MGNLAFPPAWSPARDCSPTPTLRSASASSHRDGATVEVEPRALQHPDHYRWSPDSAGCVRDAPDSTRLSAICVYSVEQGNSQQLTSGNVRIRGAGFRSHGRYFTSANRASASVRGFEFTTCTPTDARRVGVLSNRRRCPAPMMRAQRGYEPSRAVPSSGGRRLPGQPQDVPKATVSRSKEPRPRNRRTEGEQAETLDSPSRVKISRSLQPPLPTSIRRAVTVRSIGGFGGACGDPGPPDDLWSLQVTVRACFLSGQAARTRLALRLDDKRKHRPHGSLSTSFGDERRVVPHGTTCHGAIGVP